VFIMNTLVQRGLSIHATDNAGYTVLMTAVSMRHNAAVEWLLQRGIAIDAVNKEGSTALHIHLTIGEHLNTI
jgi:ankyrin repeat protein